MTKTDRLVIRITPERMAVAWRIIQEGGAALDLAIYRVAARAAAA